MISFGPTDEQELVRSTLREFAADVLRPAAREADESSQLPEGLLDQAWSSASPTRSSRARWAAATRRARRSRTRWCSRSSAAATPRSASPCAAFAVRLRGGRPRHPGAEEALAPALHRPRFPAASWPGSSPRRCSTRSRSQTTAEPKHGSFVLSGKKRCVVMGDRAEHFLVIAKNAQSARPASARSTPSWCRRRQGSHGHRDREEPRPQAVPTAGLVLDRVEVSAEDAARWRGRHRREAPARAARAPAAPRCCSASAAR